MVKLDTNRPEYANDIAEEIRLFLGFADILLNDPAAEAEWTMRLMLEQDDAPNYRIDGTLDDDAYTAHFVIEDDASDLARKKDEKRQLKLAAYALLKRRYPAVETPWGSLTGIRPTKLFRDLTDEGGEEYAAEMFRQTFDVTKEKTALAGSICTVQRDTILSASERDVDVYIGIPFCRTRCLYCSFASELLRNGALLAEYLPVLEADIAAGAALLSDCGMRVRAVYVGGGTPTVLTAAQLDQLLTYTERMYGSLGTECTVEAGRPDTIDREKLEVMRAHRVGRVSINPQTMNDDTLRCVGRTHTAADIAAVFELAREVGFSAINMDFIAGLPGEGTAEMARSMAAAERLRPDNLTVHALAIKRSSPLKKQLDDYPLPSAQTAAEMTGMGAEAAARLGMRPYYMYRQKYMRGNLENIGYAMPGKECIYNIDMMEETVSILSHGAGAMSKRVFGREGRIERIPAPKDVPSYLHKLDALIEAKRRLFLGDR